MEARYQELQRLNSQELSLKAKLQPEADSSFQPLAISTPAEQVAIDLSDQWQVFILDPTDESAAELQRQAHAAGQDAVELEALRLRLALQLPGGSLDTGLVEQLRGLEQRLRSPQSRGGHLGPPSPSR